MNSRLILGSTPFVGELETFGEHYPQLIQSSPVGECYIDAENDLEAVQAWLYAYRDKSPNTVLAYRKEAIRFVLWLLFTRNETFSQVKQSSVEAYKAFLVEPGPYWCGPRTSIHSPHWRPFQKGLAQKSRSDAMSALKCLFNFLCDAHYLTGNPFRLVKSAIKDSVERRNRAQKSRERVLYDAEIAVIMKSIEHYSRNTKRQEAIYQRAKFLMVFLTHVGPRTSELLNSCMSSFETVQGKVYWKIQGKGGLERKVPLNDTALKALRLYRITRGLPPDIGVDEASPLLINVRNGNAITTRDGVYDILKTIFRHAIAHTHDPSIKNTLQNASTHWLRHTFATKMHSVGIADDLRQQALGHANRATTEIYTHFEDKHFHDEFQKLNPKS